MRITSKGQVTILARLREETGLLPNTEVEFTKDKNGNIVMFRARKGGKSKKPTRGQKLVARLCGSGDIRMTTDEMMALMRGDD
jgi:AbrB family looped-hinge helix DNA binding protein